MQRRERSGIKTSIVYRRMSLTINPSPGSSLRPYLGGVEGKFSNRHKLTIKINNFIPLAKCFDRFQLKKLQRDANLKSVLRNESYKSF